MKYNTHKKMGLLFTRPHSYLTERQRRTVKTNLKRPAKDRPFSSYSWHRRAKKHKQKTKRAHAYLTEASIEHLIRSAPRGHVLSKSRGIE